AQEVHQVMLAPRGAILDRNGNRLAYDVPAYMLDIRTQAFSDLTALAQSLSPALGQPADQVYKVLQRSHTWVRWPQPLMEPAKEQVLAAVGKDHASDVTFTPTEERFYPYGDFASNLLGYVTYDGKGAAGIEAEYDHVLAGDPGDVTYTVDGAGFPLQSSMQVNQPPKPGEDIELTLDQTIQGFVENKMNELVQKYHPEHAAILVSDPNTGEILGMTSRPSFDPNHYAQADPQALSDNWAVSDAFEPGSTFKILTLAAGLATHAIRLDDKVQSGHIEVAGRTIHDWKPEGWGLITYRQALEYSSNAAFAAVALKLGWNTLLDYMQRFGFLNKTGIDLPAEANSIIFPPSSRHTLQLATSGFGQGIAVTPLQQLMAVGAIANGGKLIQPHLAKAFLDPATGKVVQSVQPKVLNPQVVPPDVVQQVNDTLVRDITEGIDAAGNIPGYQVAGKTGTANVADPKTGKYYSDRLIVSFIGYAPANHPRFEVYVTLYWPKTSLDNTWGSTIATPAARDILQECLEYAHIPPSDPSQVKLAADVAAHTTKYVQTPDLQGMTQAAAQARLQQEGLTAQWVGNAGAGSTVRNQWPAAGIQVTAGSKVYVNLGSPGSPAPMPDLHGLSLREADNVLAALGASLQAVGSGFAVSQSLPPGQPVQPGSKVTVQFQPAPNPVQALAAAATHSNAQGGTSPGPGSSAGMAAGTG
ncbi:MAG: PASTA domain-containing protein, partial [Alicyclobacillus sp.]|nr:PASTA domain-containing protein [Alicyclobacillus sp.]